MSDETLERNKLLLNLMTHVYEEDERRNELVDSKNSQIVFAEDFAECIKFLLLKKPRLNLFSHKSEFINSII